MFQNPVMNGMLVLLLGMLVIFYFALRPKKPTLPKETTSDVQPEEQPGLYAYADHLATRIKRGEEVIR